MNNQGQSLVGIIIVLVVVGLISGGLYYYFSRQIPEVFEIPERPAEEEVVKEEVVPEEMAREEKIEEKSVEKPIVQKCTDGTLYGQCSINKPKYCEKGNLIDKASLCGCPKGYEVAGKLCVSTQTTQNCRILSESTKDHSKAIDIIIIGADKVTEHRIITTDLKGQTSETITKIEYRYSSKPKQLLSDAQTTINDFLSIEPFNQYRSIFNFYLANEMTEWGTLRSKDIKDWKEIAQGCGISYDIAAILVNTGYEEIRTFETEQLGCGGGNASDHIEYLQCTPTFVHEMGHMFGLGDKRYFGAPGPGIYGNLDLCGKPLCPSVGLKYTDMPGGTCCRQLTYAPGIPGMSGYYATNENTVMDALSTNDRRFSPEEREYLESLLKEVAKKGYIQPTIKPVE